MQLLDRLQLTLSVDSGSNPQDICLKKTEDTSDTLLLLEKVSIDQPLPVATTVIDMGTILQGRFLFMEATDDCQIIFNGGAEPIDVRGGKHIKGWFNFTAISVVVSSAPNQVRLLIAGE